MQDEQLFQEHPLNLEESLEVYYDCADIYPSMCYNNIYNVFKEMPQMFLSGKWRVAYGYLAISETNDSLLARHCFIVNEKSEAIDPTTATMTRDNPNSPRYYISFKIFNDINEYLDAILISDNNPDLMSPKSPTKNLDLRLDKWAYENGKALIR